MAISSSVGVRHARTLLSDIAACNVEPPKVLVDLVSAFDDLAQATATTDPAAELVKAVAGGRLRGKELDKQIAAAAAALQVQEFRRGLQQRVERPLLMQFVQALDEGGAADAVIDSLRPQFDEAAAELAACAQLVDPTVDAEVFLSSATADGIRAWQAIDEHVTTLTKIGSAVGHFGPHSTSFPLSEVPASTSTPTGFLNNVGVLCVDPQWGLERGCRLFMNHGTHRGSPWFKGASMLKLNSIAEVREKVRSWAEAQWDALGINQGRGRFEDGQFIPEPVRNPYALAKEEVRS